MGEKIKKCCCLNYLRMEALVATIFDTTLSIVALCAIVVLYCVVDEAWLASVQDCNMFGIEDLRQYIQLDVQTRELSILIIVTLIALHIFMNSLLFVGIYKRNSIMVRVWFVCAIMTYLIALVIFFSFIYVTYEKIINSCVFGAYILFYLYFLWIIKLFLKELVTVSYASQEQLNQDTGSEKSVGGEENSIDSQKS